MLNIAESDPAMGDDRKKGFRTALKEASECKGGLLLLKLRKQTSKETFEHLWKLDDRLCAMLFRLSHPD